MKRESYLKILDSLKDIHVIKIVTGVRRSGKSTLLRQFRERLIDGGVSDSQIFTYNLESKDNEKYTQDSNLLHDTILSQISKDHMNYVFLDEIQLVPDFEKTLDSLFLHDNIDIYVTGSNAYLTSSDIGTLLSGRYVEVKMQPLTFSEFLQFFPDKEVDRFSKFQLFYRYGGFPEVANLLVADKADAIPLYLNSILQTVVEKDIKTRKNIRFMDDFNNTLDFAFNNLGNTTSPNKIANTLQMENRAIDKATVDGYLTALSDCYILYEAKRFDIRGKSLLKTLSKYYAVDLGLVNALLGLPASVDSGHRLENIVFLELYKRYNGQVWVGKNYDKEIDFVAKRTDGTIDYYQVAKTLADDATRSREFAAIDNTGDDYNKTILSMDVLETDDHGIRRKNIINWLCE